MNLDRQAIERRDFPIARRGYDTAAVDAHLQSLALEFEELERSTGGSEASLASTASTQVQGIIAAAETAAAEIERQAAEAARSVREEADRDARQTRDDALQKARAHVAAVADATAKLLERVGAMDGETAKLLESLRSGAGRLSADLATLDSDMGALYDASAGPVGGRSATGDRGPEASAGAFARRPEPSASPSTAGESVPPAPATPPPAVSSAPAAAPTAPPAAPDPPPATAPPTPAPAAPPSGGGDLDGARLVALNMALNGESRADTDRYLAENFELADRAKLVDEVYAAVEG